MLIFFLYVAVCLLFVMGVLTSVKLYRDLESMEKAFDIQKEKLESISKIIHEEKSTIYEKVIEVKHILDSVYF